MLNFAPILRLEGWDWLDAEEVLYNNKERIKTNVEHYAEIDPEHLSVILDNTEGLLPQLFTFNSIREVFDVHVGFADKIVELFDFNFPEKSIQLLHGQKQVEATANGKRHLTDYMVIDTMQRRVKRALDAGRDLMIYMSKDNWNDILNEELGSFLHTVWDLACYEYEAAWPAASMR